MNHPNTLCHKMMSEAAATDDSSSPSSAASLSVLVDNALCLPGRNYKDFVALEFFVVVTAAAFAWACIFFALDMVREVSVSVYSEVYNCAYRAEHPLLPVK